MNSAPGLSEQCVAAAKLLDGQFRCLHFPLCASVCVTPRFSMSAPPAPRSPTLPLFCFKTDRRSVLDALELVILTIDELVDGGMILETDPNNLVSRVLMRGVHGQGEVPITELTIGQVVAPAHHAY